MGSGGTAYRVTLRGGDLDTARTQIESQTWVSEIQAIQENGEQRWIVAVNDSDIAESQLLRLLLANEDLVVSDFRRREYELEEIFMDVVQGGNDGGQ